MEVTKHNFKEALESIKSFLKNADFISFDLELTGLGRSLGDRNHDLDTPEERYQKAMKRVKEYGITQIGISIFRYCKSSNKYLNATFCFFLSGKLEGSYRYDTSSMIFLANNGFDFNKLFLEGLTFISLTNEEEIRNKRKTKLQQDQESTILTPIKLKEPKVKAFVNDTVKMIKKSLISGEPAVLEGKLMNGFFRKVLFSNVAPLFPSSYFQSVSGVNRNIKVIHFPSEEEKRKYVDAAWEEDLNEQMGFAHVVKALLESNKPMVGHNMILDILHFVDKFVAPLPPRLDQFKALVKTNLPTIYDTKVFARDPPFSESIMNTALECLYEDLTLKFSPPKFGGEEKHNSYSITDKGQAHDGGFDAFMTGVCFITMLKTLDGKHWGKTSMMKSKQLSTYSNKINFMGSYDIPYIDLDKPDVIPDRSHIYIVTCPSSWTNNNVRHTFSCLKAYKSIWMNDTLIFVIPQDEGDVKRAKVLLKDIRAVCAPNVKVDLYKQKEEEPVKKNGKLNNSSGVKTRPKDIVRPSSISLKRSSDAKDTSASGADEGNSSAAEFADSGRNLKRLKSVGSELLSNMTLESPMNVDAELPNHNDHEKDPKPAVFDTSEVLGVDDTSGMFSVPDDW